MKLRSFLAAAFLLLMLTTAAQAWNNAGHMTRGLYRLSETDRSHPQPCRRSVAENPMYDSWTAGISDDQKGLVAFMRAANLA